MRYRPLPTKEGGYVRTGSRTPMQWDAGLANLGFSEAGDPTSLYLPVEDGPSAPGAAPVTVADRMADPDSLWRWMQAALRFRHATPALASDSGFEVLSGDGRLFAYRRTTKDAADSVIVAMNPGRDTLHLHLGDADHAHAISLAVGEPSIDTDGLVLPPQSLAILR